MKKKWTYGKPSNQACRIFVEDLQARWDSVVRSLLLRSHVVAKPLSNIAITTVFILASVVTAAGQTIAQRTDLGSSFAAADLVALKQSCGAAEPRKETFQLVQKHACSGGYSREAQMLAFEENRLFIYALADMSDGLESEDADDSQKGVRRIRRFFLLKPSTFVVADLVRTTGPERPIRWLLQCVGEPKIEDGWTRVIEADTEIIGESLLPANASLRKASPDRTDSQPVEFHVEVIPKQTSQEVRFLQVFHLAETGQHDTPAPSTVTGHGEQLELTITTRERVFRLTLPSHSPSAGKIKVATVDGKLLMPNRLLPFGVMPHGSEGARLLERWDAPYRQEPLPGWDVGRPCSHLVEAVEDETFRPGRAIVLGCGTGTNAIYLASKGFDVTGVDVAPTALIIAAEKADKVGVQVEWMLADVVAMPKLEEFDLVFDRGCYHHIQKYDSARYVETLRRLSHRSTRTLILAGSPADGGRGGPPRVKEQTIRNDFSALFNFEWVRVVRFDTRDANAQGDSAWLIHLRRKDERKGASELSRSLREFAAKGNMKAVRSMIDQGADVNGAEDGFKETALHRAAMNGHKDVSKLLVDNGARLDTKDVWPGGTALDYASENGHKDVVGLLIAHGASVHSRREGRPEGDTPLHSAVRAGHEDVVKLLIDKGADVNAKNNNGQSPIDLAASNGHGDIGELLQVKAAETSIHWAAILGSLTKVKALVEGGTDVNIEDKNCQTPLHEAIRNKHEDVAKFLIEQGADVNAMGKGGYTPLYPAIWNGDADMIELLVSRGADVNYSPEKDHPPLHHAVWMENTEIVRVLLEHRVEYDIEDRDGKTAFQYVLDAKNGEMVGLFIAAGADVNTSNATGTTALHIAAAAGRNEICELLVAKGAEVNARALNGQTPLHMAAEEGHLDVVRLLVKNCAEANAKDRRGQTPLDLANQRRHTAIVGLLKKHGAKE